MRFCRITSAIVLLVLLGVLKTASAQQEQAPNEHNFLYVATPGVRNYLEYGGHGLLVFDIDDGHKFIKRIPTGGFDANGKPLNVKGVCAHAESGRVYISTIQHLLCLDLVSEKLLWERKYGGGCDRMSITPDGKTIYTPSFEGPHWNVINAADGEIIKKITPNSGAHNTVVSRDGRLAFLAGLRSPELTVVDTATNEIVRKVGPFAASIRPFTVNSGATKCFVNINELLGFEVGEITTGQKLHRVEVQGYSKGKVKRHGCPSHGIGLTPDEREIWVVDATNERLHIFDATTSPPKQLESIKLKDEPGWVTFSIDGKYAYPSTGDVIDAKSRKIITELKDETGAAVQSEKMLEIVFVDGKPVRNGDQFGVGRAAANANSDQKAQKNTAASGESSNRHTDAVAFPLRASDNGRYLVDQRGRPFFYHADTGWRIVHRLKPDDVEVYLKDRKQRGFNSLHFHAINKEQQVAKSYAGHEPFDPREDVTRPNEPYWKNLDHVLKRAEDEGFLVAISSSWFGWQGGGWRKDLNPENAKTYGEFLGRRYKDRKNLIWIQGGDNDPDDKIEVIRAIAKAIKETAPHHLHTVHTQHKPSAAFFADDDWLDINMAYTYGESFQQVLPEYRRTGRTRPIILGETGYEGEGKKEKPWWPHYLRRQAYRAILSGASGHAFGSANIWHFADNWPDWLDKPGVNQMRHVRTLFESRPFWKLVPDDQHRLVTDGQGKFDSEDYASAAIAEDRSFAIVYVPTPRTLVLDVGKIEGPKLRAWWFNPRDGRTYDAAGKLTEKPFLEITERGEQKFSTPSQGAEDDWILALDSTGSELPPLTRE